MSSSKSDSSPARITRLLPVSQESLTLAAQCLRAGGLVAFPTETVYGLGADATNPAAIARLYAAKGRPQFNPLITHIPNLEEALALGFFSPEALQLAHAFWPGPLTLVVPCPPTSPICELSRAGLASIALRVPDHPTALALLQATQRPISAPSANRSGHISPTRAEHVMEDLNGEIDYVLAGVPPHIGLESTIVSCLGAQITLLRPGKITKEALEDTLKRRVKSSAENAHQPIAHQPIAPGQLTSHYAPHHPLRLDAHHIKTGEACLTFGEIRPEGADGDRLLNLSPSGDLVEAAANLYAYLRAADQLTKTGIAIVPLPRIGLGEAIADRLKRAAAPKTGEEFIHVINPLG